MMTTTEQATATTRPAANGYAGADWLATALAQVRPKATISPFGRRVADLLGELFQGLYHWDGWGKVDWSNERWIRVSVGHVDWSTYDSSLLTHLVLLAHREAIRVQMAPCNFSHLELYFHPRSREDSSRTSAYHPTLAEAAARFEQRG